MAKLTAARTVLHLNRLYQPGEELPQHDASLVDAWLEAGSAIYEEAPQEPPQENQQQQEPPQEATQQTDASGDKEPDPAAKPPTDGKSAAENPPPAPPKATTTSGKTGTGSRSRKKASK